MDAQEGEEAVRALSKHLPVPVILAVRNAVARVGMDLAEGKLNAWVGVLPVVARRALGLLAIPDGELERLREALPAMISLSKLGTLDDVLLAQPGWRLFPKTVEAVRDASQSGNLAEKSAEEILLSRHTPGRLSHKQSEALKLLVKRLQVRVGCRAARGVYFDSLRMIPMVDRFPKIRRELAIADVRKSYKLCGYKTATNSHSTFASVGSEARVDSSSSRISSRDAGMSKAYCLTQFTVTHSEHKITVRSSWRKDVLARGVAVVNGKLTLDVWPDRDDLKALWVEQSRGTLLTERRGRLVRNGTGWVHKEEKRS
jgi:hypothetical protein